MVIRRVSYGMQELPHKPAPCRPLRYEVTAGLGKSLFQVTRALAQHLKVVLAVLVAPPSDWENMVNIEDGNPPALFTPEAGLLQRHPSGMFPTRTCESLMVSAHPAVPA